MGQGIDGQMRPYREAWEWDAPVEGHDVGLKFRIKGSVRVRYSEVLHGRERVAEPCSYRVDRRGGTH